MVKLHKKTETETGDKDKVGRNTTWMCKSKRTKASKVGVAGQTALSFGCISNHQILQSPFTFECHRS